MEVLQVLHMNGGEGETSYAYNSSLQRTVIKKVEPVIEETILDLLCRGSILECMNIADLGCSSGPNSLLVISKIVDIANKACRHRLDRIVSPGFQLFLNDLPGNDFNTVFKSLPAFHEQLKKENSGPCFIAATPGSFYDRLFPDKTIHFLHSSYSLPFLSQVPQGLESEDGIPLNKGNVYLARTSPPSVLKAYREQFHKDFSLFLKLRSEEIVPGGRAVLTFMGRRIDDPSRDENCTPWKMLALALNDMVSEGLVEEAKVDSFNITYYAASAREIRGIIEAEGSFNLDRLEIFLVGWDGNMVNDRNVGCTTATAENNLRRAKTAANTLRAAAEPMLEWHFGRTVIDDLFNRFTAKLAQLYSKEEPMCVNLVVSMTNKKNAPLTT